MILKSFLWFVGVVFLFFLLFFYWFYPGIDVDFQGAIDRNYNFSINSNQSLQFYENMRFPSSLISYKIEDCPVQRANDMEQAFNMIENKTMLKFYSVTSNEDISVSCDSNYRVEGNLIIAGEGGPTNIIKTNSFHVITHGNILLLRNSYCENPNIAIHEALHVLGFNHSDNPKNIMYPVSKCGQEIGEDTIELINTLYSVQSYSDLSFTSASAQMKNRFLDMEFSITNDGFEKAENSRVEVYDNDKLIKIFEVDPIEVGEGRKVILENIFIPYSNIDSIKILIKTDYPEINKKNNEVNLEIRN